MPFIAVEIQTPTYLIDPALFPPGDCPLIFNDAPNILDLPANE